MQEIAAAIQAGAKAYLNRQYTHDPDRRRRAVRGARRSRSTGRPPAASRSARCCRALAGYIGMNISVRANVRTAAGGAPRA